MGMLWVHKGKVLFAVFIAVVVVARGMKKVKGRGGTDSFGYRKSYNKSTEKLNVWW